MNSTHQNGKSIPGIKCDVTNCHYNDMNHKCTAREVSVGPQYANSSADTICATFKPDSMPTNTLY